MKSVVRSIIEVFKKELFGATLSYRLGTMYFFKTNKEDLTRLIESSEDENNITLGFELMNGDYGLYAVDVDKLNVATKLIRSMAKHKDYSIANGSSLKSVVRDIELVKQKLNKEKW